MNLFEEIYDGELNFIIENYTIENDVITMDLMAEYEGESVGLRVAVPVQNRRMMFKSVVLPNISSPIVFTSLGECSDRFVAALDRIWAPDFEVEGGFTADAVEAEYAVLNREIFDCTKEKTYFRIYYTLDMETGDEFDNMNMELGFNFNLERKRASFIELKRQMRNDFLAMIMA